MKGTQNTRELVSLARRLLGPKFLYRVGDAIGRLGVVGEERNRLTVFLAGITKELDETVSVMITGPSSSGKSKLLRTALQLFPPTVVVERASLSGKAPAYMKKPLAKKILYLQEYRGGKEAQYFIRQLQSEGRILHEATTVTGAKRKTEVARHKGRPVVLSSTTQWPVFVDDVTRFLPVSVDESPEQTRAIARAQIRRTREPLPIKPPLQVWQHAVSLIKRKKTDFQNPPDWLDYVVDQLPSEQVRVRRDSSRFLMLLEAIALCRRGVSDKPADITFADYIVAYKILEPALAATSSDLPPQVLQVLKAIENLLTRSPKGVTPKAIAKHLGWKAARVYKTLKLADEHGAAIQYKPGTRKRNRKPIIGVQRVSDRFLPRPMQVLRNRKELTTVIQFIDPFSGKRKRLERR